MVRRFADKDASSREVELAPKRRRKRSPSDRRRKAKRAMLRQAQIRGEINNLADERQGLADWNEAGRTWRLERLEDRLAEARADAHRNGVQEGTPFKGHTSGPSGAIQIRSRG